VQYCSKQSYVSLGNVYVRMCLSAVVAAHVANKDKDKEIKRSFSHIGIENFKILYNTYV